MKDERMKGAAIEAAGDRYSFSGRTLLTPSSVSGRRGEEGEAELLSLSLLLDASDRQSAGLNG